MAKKRKQISSSQETAERENRRGRTVCTVVGKAIQNGTKIPLQWNHRKLPCGDHKATFVNYIGVVARQRVSINYSHWRKLPKEVIDEVYSFITKAFIVPEDRRGYALKQASKRQKNYKNKESKLLMSLTIWFGSELILEKKKEF